MPWGSIISGLVQGGLEIYGALSQPSQQHIRGIYASQLRQQADTTLRPFTNQGYWNIDPAQLEQQSITFGLTNAPTINAANMQQLSSLLNQALPGYQGMVGQAEANTTSLLKGNVPADVQDQIQRSAAFQTLQSGAFAGSAPTGAVTARDLGLTSLNLQQQGFSQMQGLIGTARNYLMPQPVNPLSLLPLSDLISGQEWTKSQTFNATAQYYNARANALAAQYGGPQTSITGALGTGAQSILGALTSKNQQTGQSGMGSIIGLIGSLFKQGGGSSGTSDGLSSSSFTSGLNTGAVSSALGG